jgi:UrcA family protein
MMLAPIFPQEMTMTLNRKIFASLATALALTAAIPAHAAQAAPGDPVETVSYADLDLGTATGRAKLRMRVDAAMRRMCDEGVTMQDVRTKRAGACRLEAGAAGDQQALAMVTGGATGAQLAKR